METLTYQEKIFLNAFYWLEDVKDEMLETEEFVKQNIKRIANG